MFEAVTIADQKKKPFISDQKNRNSEQVRRILEGRQQAALLKRHQGLLYRFSAKTFGRLDAAGVPVDFDDVLQENQITLMKADRTYDASKGVGFCAYMGRACWNNSNKQTNAAIEEQFGLGLVRLGDKQDSEGGDLDMLANMQSEAPGPEEVVMNREIAIRRFQMLSEDAKQILRSLVQPSDELKEAFRLECECIEQHYARGVPIRVAKGIDIKFIGRQMGLTDQAIRHIKQEFTRVFEVAL